MTEPSPARRCSTPRTTSARTAVAAIHRAFLLAKTSHNAWRSYKREGRFDLAGAPGASACEQDVFKRKTGVSTTRVRCRS